MTKKDLNHYAAGTIACNTYSNDPERVVNCIPQTEVKVWGTEEHIHNDRHCVKIMKMKPGYQVSLHFHSNKEETFILYSGRLIIESINQLGERDITELTRPLESFTLYSKVAHTFYCPDDQDGETVFLEASTTDSPDDSYRIEPSKEREPIIDR